MSQESPAGGDTRTVLSLARAWLHRVRAKLGRPPADEPEQPAASATENQFQDKVFPRELEYVRARREAVEETRPGLQGGSAPTVENELVGLALSGGGIRSATFSLGVLQALERRGVFKFIDYLSTVSGGGFLGTSLSTLMSQPARDSKGVEQRAEFPFRHREDEDEEPPVSYLRNNSNYLAPRGPLDYVRVFAVLVRGIILNFLVLLPFLLISSLVVTYFYGQSLLDRLQADREQQQIAQLVERDWTGMDGEEAVESLLDAIEAQSMLNEHRGTGRKDVERSLTGDAGLRGGVRRETLPPLIRESREAVQKHAFRSVTPAAVFERLWRSQTLRDPDALREVDAIERTVRDSRRWIPKAQREPPGSPLKLSSLFLTLQEEKVLLTRIDPVARFAETLQAANLIKRTPGKTRSEPLSSPRGPLEPSDLDGWIPEGSRNLRRILQHLYDFGAYDPRWLDDETRKSDFSPPLAYWPAYEISVLERELLSDLDPQQRAALTRSSVDLALLGLEAARRGMLYAGPEGATGRQTLTSIFRGEPGDVSTLHWGIPVSAVAPPLSYVGEKQDLHEVLHQLWEHGALAEAWFTRRFDDRPPVWSLLADPKSWFARQPDDHPPAYRGQLDQLKDRAEREARGQVRDPAPLPGTRFLLRVGLLWILLYPLLLTFRRVFRLLDEEARLAAAALMTSLVLASGILVYIILVAQSSFAWMHADLEWPAGLTEFFDSPGRYTTALFLAAFLLLGIGPFVMVLLTDLRKLAGRVNNARWRDGYERSFGLVLILIALVAFVEAQPYLIYHYQYLQAGHVWWSLGIGAASIVASMIAGPALASFKKVGKKVVLSIIALLGPLLPTLVYIHLVLWVISFPGVYDSVAYRLDENYLIVFLLVLAFIAHLVNLPIDANSTSLHSFYRDRLSRAYLIRREDNDVVPEDDLPLSKICAEHSGAPYHLINTALNLQGTRDPRLRRRRGDFFLFSRDFIGSKQTGYCATEDLEKLFPHVQASSAMAVSAAAAAPNMGTSTSGPLVVLMALLNIRLGYWIPNPARVNSWLPTLGAVKNRALRRIGLIMASLVGSFRTRPGAYLLLKEMLSMMDGHSRMVNLSDGGHMENTGVLELLRRRCQFIVACDAEADPELRFGGLAALIRYARIDLGIEIDIHPDDLRLDAEGESRQHCALGSIRYPSRGTGTGEVGYLLYIKSSITGDEDELISEYRGRSPQFPHESTADQFFDERQFEAYRALGDHICGSLFDELGQDRLETFAECSEWFQSLAVSLSPGLAGSVTFSDVQSELGNVERMLREPCYSDYFYEIYPELERPGSVKTSLNAEDEAKAFRDVFHLANIQLQLMESVFVSTELGQKANREHPGNRGWMNLFRRWSKAPSFRRAYLASITTYSAPFQQFCRAALGLDLDFQWHRLTETAREKLEPQAEATGLKSLAQPLSETGRTLILTAAAPGTESIVIGEAIILTDGTDAEVGAFEMRAGYQGAGMRARALMALRHWTENEDLTLGISDAAAVATQASEFDFDHACEEPGEQ